jgi:heme/copper-type cytochrome/quinol oxidase subunit 4
MGGMGHIDEIIKKWVIYIILFLSSIVVAVDLVILVRYFVAGEITNRFIYKVISALLVAFVVGIYYILLLQNKDESKSKKHNIIFGIIAILIFMVSIIYSFLIMGSPAKQRLLRLDEKRVTDLQSIQYQIITYWQQKEKLPENLSVLSNSMNGFSLPVPPEFQNGEKYEFTIKDEKKLTFELCADFSLPIQKGWQENNYTNTMPTSLEINRVGGNESWNHDVGRTCYSRTIDKDIYPPFSKTNK